MTNYFQTLRESVKHWYIPLIIGILLICMGIYVFTVPLESYVMLSMLFSISFIVSGLGDIVFSIQNNKSLSGWGWYLVSGILSLALGIYLTVYPGVSMSILPFVVGFTLLFRSFLLLGFAFDLRNAKVVSWGDVALLSVLGILFSILLLANPFFTSVSLVTLTALTFIFVGIASIVLAFRLKKVKDLPGKVSSDLKDRMENLQSEVESQLKQK